MFKESENTVPAVHQLPQDGRMRGEGDGRPRILFLGNSVTLHGPAPAIGWHGDWGMAASRAENDYVHVCMRRIRAQAPDAAWRIGQLADWERAFWTDEEVLGDFAALRDWQPDVIFCVFLGANTPPETMQAHDFAEHYARMLRFFNPEGRAKVVVTDMFWANPEKDAAVRAAAEREGAALVPIGDLGATDEMLALSEYEHRGVGGHPGDRGMRAIAERLLAAAGME